MCSSLKLLKLANFASLLIHIQLVNISSVWGNGGAILPSLNTRNLPSSDEKGPDLLTLTEGYKKIIPPFTVDDRTTEYDIIPVTVNVSLRLLTVMNIDENDNTIDLQFEIILTWKDYRISFSNLNDQTFLNALTEKNIESIWLPLVVYDNTDQKETTRLGWKTEWKTTVVGSKEGNFIG